VYKLPEELEAELQKKFPNVHIQTITQYIFSAILNKTFNDGSCSIREFGKFVSFKTRSSRTSQDVIRFKFKISNTLNQKIKQDQYLINNTPVKALNVFSDKHEEKTKDKKLQHEANVIAQKEAEKLGKVKTQSQLVVNIINSIVDKET